MRSIFDKMPSHQPFIGSEQEMRDLYTKFRILGANVDKLKQLGLAAPELEQLLERLESVHDKKLLHFITTIAHAHQTPDSSSGTISDSNKVLKICPRCTRDITRANIIKENSQHMDDSITFVVVCVCGYMREIRRTVARHLTLQRQSTLKEYASV